MNWAELLPLVIFVVAAWFLLLRPMRNRQRQMTKLQQELTIGSRVMLTSGIFGDVVSIGDDTIELSIAPGTTVTVVRQAVGRVLPAATDDAPRPDDVEPTEGS